jgi:LysR family transcriptional regulator, low CO2-responsive transcriptional regulator
MLDIYEMQIFLAAAEAGSFSAAGRRLQLSQPAVSMQIRSLEKRLNIELFHRSGRHIELTEIGQSLIPMARQLVDHALHVQQSIISMKGEVVGNLDLACSTTGGKYALPRIIAGFVDQYPMVTVTCYVFNRGLALAQLVGGEAHIAITSLREVSQELDYRPFAKDEVILIAHPTHPWAADGTIPPDRLPQARFIRRELASGTMQTVVEELARHDINPAELPTVMVMGNSEAICMAVSEGIGVAFVSRCAAAEALGSSKVAQITIQNVRMVQQLYMVRHAGNMMVTAQNAFWDYVFSLEGNSHEATL